MASERLQAINLTDFTGGWCLRRDQFTLAENESPDMLNVDVDPRGGFFTRHGWRRWNVDDIDAAVDATNPWHPMNAVAHTLASGEQQVFVTESHKVYVAGASTEFVALTGPVADAGPHGADFAAWGNDVYIVCGMFRQSYRYEDDGTVVALDPDWSEVDAPVGNVLPQAEHCEAHAGYLFVACTSETGNSHYTRVRWSHPNRPDAWRESDYIDIDADGGKITAIVSFLDHLLIFKTSSMWALYGYDEDSWQLVKVSHSIGCPSPTAVARSETATYFFSASNGGGIYAYNGGQPVYLSEKLRVAFETIEAYDKVFVSWANRRLWVSVPWRPVVGPTLLPSSLFVFDSDIGEGAWTQYRSEYGAVTSVVTGSDINAKFPLAAFWSESTAAMLVLDVIEDAYDEIFIEGSLGVTPDDGYLVTGLDEEILIGGETNRQPFEAYYRTGWLHAGAPDRRKSWRRPMFICRRVPRKVDLLVQQYRDYDETTIRRVGLVYGVEDDNSVWSPDGSTAPDGIDWGEGGTWGASTQGALLARSGPMGHAAAIQMKVLPSADTPRRKWGVDGIVVKLTIQRFRT